MTGVNVVGYETIGFGTKKPQDVASTLGTTAIRTSRNWEITEFVRMLAKIGYGYAVAEGGPIPLDEVLVLPLILGTADDGGTWVGSAEYRLSVEDKRPNHALGAVQLSAIVDGVTEHVTVARVKLFSNAGATGYEVLVRRTRVPT
jgi:hypothetical protein